MAKFLLVTGDFVYPTNHGGRVDVWNRILTIHKMGEYIHLICTVKKYPKQEYINIVNNKVDKLTIIQRKNNLFDMICKRPLQMTSRKKLKEIDLNDEYEYLILEGTYVYDILDNPKLNAKKKIIRMHNDETIYFYGLGKSTRNIFKKIYFYIESLKFRFNEKSLIRRLGNIMFISYDEMCKYKKKYPYIKECFLPTAVNFDFKTRDMNSNNVLIIGALFMDNNKEGIKRYIKTVHPLLNDVLGYKLIIAGNTLEQGIEWLEKITVKYRNIELYDSPKNLEFLYKKAAVFVNPMINGAGVKLKTINAIVQGLPVVSTTVGNQGTGLIDKKDIFIADKADDMAKCIKNILKNKDVGREIVKSGQEFIKNNYNQKEILREYLDEL